MSTKFIFRLSSFEICEIDADTKEIAQEQFAKSIGYDSWESLAGIRLVDYIAIDDVEHYSITLSCYLEDSYYFAEWLCKQGHTAIVGNSLYTYVDGVSNAASNNVQHVIDKLHSQFLRQFW